jgi:hypothetical protein
MEHSGIRGFRASFIPDSALFHPGYPGSEAVFPNNAWVPEPPEQLQHTVFNEK